MTATLYLGNVMCVREAEGASIQIGSVRDRAAVGRTGDVAGSGRTTRHPAASAVPNVKRPAAGADSVAGDLGSRHA